MQEHGQHQAMLKSGIKLPWALSLSHLHHRNCQQQPMNFSVLHSVTSSFKTENIISFSAFRLNTLTSLNLPLNWINSLFCRCLSCLYFSFIRWLRQKQENWIELVQIKQKTVIMSIVSILGVPPPRHNETLLSFWYYFLPSRIIEKTLKI